MSNPSDPNAKYNNARLGYNSRLDTIQAGVLLAKFDTFKNYELEAVNRVADRYTEGLKDIDGLVTPVIDGKCYSSWAQYTVQLPEGANRPEIQSRLKEDGIPTNIYYIKPMHKQGAFASTRSMVADCPVTEGLCDKVLCLPMHPYLEDSEIDSIIEKFKVAISSSAR